MSKRISHPDLRRQAVFSLCVDEGWKLSKAGEEGPAGSSVKSTSGLKIGHQGARNRKGPGSRGLS